MSQSKEKIARGMTFIAVAECGSEIGAAIPHIGFALRLLKARLTQEQNVPEAQTPALVVREGHFVRLRRRMRNRQAEQVDLDVQDVVAAQRGVRGVREGGIQRFAVLADARMQRSHEVIVAPGSDAGFLVRSDIARIDRAKWRLEGDAARERLLAGKGMAGHRVTAPRQIFPPPQWLPYASPPPRPSLLPP